MVVGKDKLGFLEIVIPDSCDELLQSFFVLLRAI
jgi:hypothetical protein